MTPQCLAILMNSDASWQDVWTRCPQEIKAFLLEGMSWMEMEWFGKQWKLFAHPHQRPPDRSANGELSHEPSHEPWQTWLLIGGRGAGKTRAGAEWVRAQALGLAPFASRKCGHIALVGESEHDVREVMIEGVSGLLAVHEAWTRPTWVSSRKRLEWDNGAVAYAFSADDPESLRGPQFDCAWADELAKWRYAEAAFDMLQFGLRLGSNPRQLITTTPRPTELIKKLIADPTTAVTRAPTQSNKYHLSPIFLKNVMARYGGTRLGRQELSGEIIEDRADALWSRDGIEKCRVREAPDCARIVVAVDPPASSGKRADGCGIVAAGIAADNIIYVLADDTVSGATPAAWASRAVALFHRLEADVIVAEVNQGGEMVEAVIKEVDHSVTVRPVRATRGKFVRAEPVAALYEQHRVRHVGSFAALEDEMCDFGVGGLSSGRSPDRVDALVWAISALAFRAHAEPRVRGL